MGNERGREGYQRLYREREEIFVVVNVTHTHRRQREHEGRKKYTRVLRKKGKKEREREARENDCGRERTQASELRSCCGNISDSDCGAVLHEPQIKCWNAQGTCRDCRKGRHGIWRVILRKVYAVHSGDRRWTG